MGALAGNDCGNAAGSYMYIHCMMIRSSWRLISIWIETFSSVYITRARSPRNAGSGAVQINGKAGIGYLPRRKQLERIPKYRFFRAECNSVSLRLQGEFSSTFQRILMKSRERAAKS